MACTTRPTLNARLQGTVRAGFLLGLLVITSACTTVIVRDAVPADKLDDAAPYGIRSDKLVIREWGDEFSTAQKQKVLAERIRLSRTTYAENVATGKPVEQISLALSGGGPDGAFGAGLLNGWSARGDRPDFKAVTGISTGAIIAVFAFLGPDYDDELTEVYTTYTTEQLLTPAIFAALTGGSAITDTSGYRALIERYIDDEAVARMAQRHAEGRILLIGTTNIDASRPVMWNVAAIAATGHPDAKRLIHDVVQASSAIPAAFPPVLIPVEDAEGNRYDEMHVDGGATQQVMLFSPSLSLSRLDKASGLKFDRTLYIIMNNQIEKPYKPVRPRVLSIAGKAASSLLGGSGTSDLYKIFAVAQRDDIDLNIQAIPIDFDLEAKEAFDPVYMKALYDLGYQIGLSGEGWSPYPPDYDPGD